LAATLRLPDMTNEQVVLVLGLQPPAQPLKTQMKPGPGSLGLVAVSETDVPSR
jgi:hypothetical protein